MSENLKPCLRCGSKNDSYTPEKIAALAQEIPLDSSAAAEEMVLKNRVNACNSCEALKENVLCSYCGCFILFRARTGKSYCPHPNGNKWEFNNKNV